MTDEPKNIPDLAAGLVSPEYAAEHPMPTLRPIQVEPLADRSRFDMEHLRDCIDDAFAGLPKRADRPAGDIGAALDAVIGSDKPFPRRYPTPRAAAYELLCLMAGIDEADPQVFAAVKDVLVDWFAGFEKGGLSLCRALGLVDDGELQDWAHDHGWSPPD